MFAHSGTVKIKVDTTPKVEDHGVHCLFVGYFPTHPTGCYRMYNPKMPSRHVWLHFMFYKKTNMEGELNTDCISVGSWLKNLQGV